MKAYWKDIWRTIVRGKKRFFSIALIATLGVTMMCGLRAACVDLRYSADQFFDEQNLFDIRIFSTLGLTSQDVEVLSKLELVEQVEGGYSEQLYLSVDGLKKSIEIRTLSPSLMNQPYVLEGELPKEQNELVITEKYKNETGYGIGESIVLTDEPEQFREKEYKIVGIITDAMDINNPDGSMSFRVTSTTDYVGYVLEETADSDVYSVIYLKLNGLAELNCYSDAYQKRVNEVVKGIEKHIKEDREQKRYEEIYNEAMKEWEEGRQEMLEEFAKADKEISNARRKLADGRYEIAKGKQELADGKAELVTGQEALETERVNAEEAFASAWEEIDAGYAEIENAELQYEQLLAEQEKVEVRIEELLNAGTEASAEEWVEVLIQKIMIEAGICQFKEKLPELEAAKQQLQEGKDELEKQELQAYEGFAAAEQELQDGWNEIAKGEREIKNAEAELADGQKELDKNVKEYESEKKKAEQELSDALKEIEELETATWYIQDRTSLSGYVNVESDADSIQAIGDIFPILFLTVAILISLTTITRMVEEERGLIGTYKALGFSAAQIQRKYVLYAGIACLLGGILGDIGGYVLLPKFLFWVFDVMYVIPNYLLRFDALYGLGGILLFEVGVVGATIFSTRRSLRKVPAKLMRPKSPKSGTRVLLERVTFIWKRMSFLNKVTARNIFRYKKRMLMTIFGIAGCTALLLIAFTIKDTVAEMLPQQYGEVYQYDLMLVAEDESFDEMEQLCISEKEIATYVPLRIESVEIRNAEGQEETVQLMVVPEGVSLDGFIKLKDKENRLVRLEKEDVLITRNATRVMNLKLGEQVELQKIDLDQADTAITGIVENYFGNTIYMTQTMYEELFGTFVRNGMLIKCSEFCEDQVQYAEDLKYEDYILSTVSTLSMVDNFETSFVLINMVVYVILVLAALLAFVVLFTLANINISERQRELATIKVLGFQYGEVHAYVNKETWILTLMGIAAGIPLGWILGRYVMGILKFPSLEFYIDLYPQSYLYSILIALAFTFIVNKITDRALDKINMVEALKSVE